MDRNNNTLTPHPKYLKGFNEGYTMAKYMPDIAKEIAEVAKDTERGNGFKEGNAQYILDKEQEKEIKNEKAETVRMPEWMQSEKEERETPSEDKDRGVIEPEID